MQVTSADVSDADAPAAEQEVLASVFGVGGTQALISIITSDTLTMTQKINVLIELFGLDEEQAKRMLEKGEGEVVVGADESQPETE
jgi:ATP-dependent Clp protease adapter protein ClpS